MDGRKNIKSYKEAVEYLLNIPKFTKKNSMEDTRDFLKELPPCMEQKKIIHVAGTNGKGSVCFYLNNLLQGAGKKVALFTSPHLYDIRERFLISGQMVSEEEFLEAFLYVQKKVMSKMEDENSGYHPTFFEFLFFMAVVLFNRKEIEYIILETGLGGRLDATNAIDKKELTIITRIGLDHTEYLGNTIEEIAYQKAGIIRPDTKVLYFGDDKASGTVIEEYAKKQGGIVQPVNKNLWKDEKFRNKNIDFSYNSRYYDYIAITVSGIAAYQIENVVMSLDALELLLSRDEMPSVEVLRKILKETVWQGRLEEVLPEVFLDGAHNEQGICAFLDSVKRTGAEHKSLLFSVVSDKDYRAIIQRISGSGLFDKIVITKIDNQRGLNVQEILQIFYECGRKDVVVIDDAEQAFWNLYENKKSGEWIFAAGSLYLVGRIKKIIGKEPK